jgi:hypothetical protein
MKIGIPTILIAACTTAYAFSTAGVGLAIAGLSGVITAGVANISASIGVEIGLAIGTEQAKRNPAPVERIIGRLSEDTKNKIIRQAGLGGAALGLAGIFGGYALSENLLFEDAQNTEVTAPTEVKTSALDSYKTNENGHYVLPAQILKLAA